MKYVWYNGTLSNQMVPVKFWVNPDSLDKECLGQIENLARLPFAKKYVVVLPDAHCGYGMPIGCVLATKDVVVPNAVGVDIGCGMTAMQIYPEELDGDVTEYLPAIRHEILQRVPVGFHHNKVSRENHMPARSLVDFGGSVIMQQWDHACYQLGTLGGGNHFIEIQRDKIGHLWVMVHSGSRNLGKRVCDYYNGLAKEQNIQNYSVVTHDQDLAFLNLSDPMAHSYMTEMNYCTRFAAVNRDLILTEILEAFCKVLGPCNVSDPIDICHNSVQIENHMGENLYIHRKGAAGPLRGDTLGIIPGSMGTASYIVAAKSHGGLAQTFYTTSHGAGRPMSRGAARATLDLEAEKKKMEGIVHGLKSEKELDEAPGAYKDIEEVMYEQRDLVEILYELQPICSIKG